MSIVERLTDLIVSAKVEQFADYGRINDHDYEGKIQLLKEGKAVDILRNEPLARQICIEFSEVHWFYP